MPSRARGKGTNLPRILLDTDIGTDVDDALALAYAASLPDVDLVAVTTVHADAPLRARIARRLLDTAGRASVPVVPGASLPLAPPTPDPFHWHARLWGHEGMGVLGAADLAPTPDLAATQDHAARCIVELASKAPGEIELVAVGPLTNVARALAIEPRLPRLLRGLTLMGGMVDPARSPWPPVLETNLNADPGAARSVFAGFPAAGVRPTVVPVEVTTRVFLTAQQRAALRTSGNPLATVLVDLMEQMREGFADFSERMGLASEDIFAGRTFMHDPVAVHVAVSGPSVTLAPMHLRLPVENGVLHTVPDIASPPNASVCVEVDAALVVGAWMDAVGRRGRSLAPGAAG